MKIITKASFLPIVCVIYTVLSVCKIFGEAVFGNEFGNYQENLLLILFFSFLATLVLSQHYRLHKWPLWLVAVIQYVILICIAMFVVWLSGFFEPLHPNAYRDVMRSFSIPYALGATIYYVSLYFEIRKTNKILQDIKEK